VKQKASFISISKLQNKLLYNLLEKYTVNVENISNGSLDSIPSPSPSVKIQTIGGKVC
jgi:hypothetical protein